MQQKDAVSSKRLEKTWQTAAEKIAAADFLLVATGAGFSADSSLPVYADIAKVAAYEQRNVEYQDLCDPSLLQEEEEIFYGFWGSCVNAYRDATPHRGYAILRHWKHQLQVKRNARDTRDDKQRKTFRATFERLQKRDALPAHVTLESVTNDPFFIYTSNVDAHFKREFLGNEVYELHGSVETWQCAGYGVSNGRKPCARLWPLPPRFRFPLDGTTMRAPRAEATTCPACGGHGRPNVLMFHDRQWIANTSEEDGYIAWESVMELMLEEDPDLNLVVLEIGCGLRVPSVRKETEMVVADVIEGCRRPQATLIRINPERPTCQHPLILANKCFLPIQSKGLEALEGIEQALGKLQKNTQTNTLH